MKNIALLLLLVLGVACGSQIVDFPVSGPDGGSSALKDASCD